MSKIKKERLEATIRKEVSYILQNEIKNDALGFVTVTDVVLTNDYSLATIFVTFLNTVALSNINRLDELDRVKGVIRSFLAKKLTIRKTPDLIFKLDDSFNQGQKIETILSTISEE